MDGKLVDVMTLMREHRRNLTILLDMQREKRNHQLAVVTNMGASRSYITSVSLRWVADHVRFATDLPIWEKKKDDSGQIILDEVTMEELRQRAPDWSRQLPMTRYLAIREHHKFPPILVAAWKSWVDDVESSKWSGGSATEDCVTGRGLDSRSFYMDLDCEDTHFYALDGQHRLMAIRGLHDLLNNRRLDKKTSEGKTISGQEITIEAVIEKREKHGSSPPGQGAAAIQNLMTESIGIEIIPVVLQGETRQQGLRRIRSIFVHVNRTAKPLQKGTLALLDEDSGFSIVARRVMVKHALLKASRRVRTDKGQVGEKGFEYTTLETLVEIAKKYLGKVGSYGQWYSESDTELPFRPSNRELQEGVDALMYYFDLLSTLPSHQELVQDSTKSCADFRGATAENDNILFRPITQIALADAIHILIHDDERKVSIDAAIELLAKAELAGKLRLTDADSIWFGVLCDVVNKKMRKTGKYQMLCANLMVHVLGGGTKAEDRTDLHTKLVEARQTGRQIRGPMGDEAECIGFDGEPIAASELKLPVPW